MGDGRTRPLTTADWRAWLTSAAAVEFLSRMTPGERRQARRRGAVDGLWCGVTLAVPTVLALWSPLFGLRTFLLATAFAALMRLVHHAGTPFRLRSQVRFICATEWGRRRGLRPDDLESMIARRAC